MVIDFTIDLACDDPSKAMAVMAALVFLRLGTKFWIHGADVLAEGLSEGCAMATVDQESENVLNRNHEFSIAPGFCVGSGGTSAILICFEIEIIFEMTRKRRHLSI